MVEAEERICTVEMAPDLITQWSRTATGSANKAVRDILGRSPSAITFFPSEVQRLTASAVRCLPGHNDLTGIDVAAKFIGRIEAFGPVAETPAPAPEPPTEPQPPEDPDTEPEDEG